MPGLYLLGLNARISNEITISRNLFNYIAIDFSIFLFFLLFFINKKNLIILKKNFFELSKLEFILLFTLFIFTIYNFDYSQSVGGGFFYKLSLLTLNNNFIFFFTFFLSIFVCFLITKQDRKFIIVIFLMMLMAINYLIFQKYFEPIFILLFVALYKNFFAENVFETFKNILIYYTFVFLYFIISVINNIFLITNNLTGVIRLF